MANISFWGGVGVIGSSKVLIEQDGWRVLLDFGLDFSPGAGLFRGHVSPRPEHVLGDRLKSGGAPHIPHIYRRDATSGTDLISGSDGKTAVFITHAHIDHIGLTGWLDPDIPIYCSPESLQIMEALQDAGMGLEGGHPQFQVVGDHESVAFGPFTVTRHPVDHDVIGASGYAVTTENGVVAFTGDIRLHGRHPEKSLDFASRVHKARALVIEGTTLSAGFRSAQAHEMEVDQSFEHILAATPGLVIMTVYPRNLERVQAFLAAARRAGRTILWPASVARFLVNMGIAQVDVFAENTLDRIAKEPGTYVVQLAVSDIPALLDLPVGPGSVFVHANGEPLGPYDPDWDVLHDWLKFTHTPFWSIGTGGHASPDDLNLLVEAISPDIVFPLHSQEPDRLIPPTGTIRWLPQRGGRRYPLGGR